MKSLKKEIFFSRIQNYNTKDISFYLFKINFQIILYIHSILFFLNQVVNDIYLYIFIYIYTDRKIFFIFIKRVYIYTKQTTISRENREYNTIYTYISNLFYVCVCICARDNKSNKRKEMN